LSKRNHNHNSKQDFFLQFEGINLDLKKRSISSGFVTVVSQGVKFVIQISGLMIMARLLGPEAFGLIGMVTVVLNFIEIFKDLGLSTATLQMAEITQQQVSNLFWINVVVAICIAMLILACSPLFTWFYNEPKLLHIFIVLSFTFILTGFSVQHLALLQRRMEFTKVAVIEVISIFSGFIAGFISIFYGADYWALVIWRLVQSLTTTLLTWIFCSWRPSLPRKGAGTLKMLTFGGSIAGFSLANYISRNLDNLLIGKVWGAQQLGIYSTAYKLLLLPIQQINAPVSSVALPALSKLQNDPEKFCNYYFKSIKILTFIGMPIVGFTASSVEAIISLTLGKEWLSSVLIFQLLLPAAYSGTLNVSVGWAFVCLGRVHEQMKCGVIASILTAILFIGGVHWGAAGVAASYGFSRPLFMLVTLMYAYNGTNLTLRELSEAIKTPFLASAVAAVIVYLLNEFLWTDFSKTFTFFLSSIVYLLIYFSFWMFFPKDRDFIVSIFNDIVKTVC
jgi:O-antigen/teichoic acid export membrane protein